MRAAGMPNCASSAAMRMSAVSAVPSPPPRQKPLIMAITGFSIVVSASLTRSDSAV